MIGREGTNIQGAVKAGAHAWIIGEKLMDENPFGGPSESPNTDLISSHDFEAVTEASDFADKVLEPGGDVALDAASQYGKKDEKQ